MDDYIDMATSEEMKQAIRDEPTHRKTVGGHFNMNLYDAALYGDLLRVTHFVEQGADKDQAFGNDGKTALIVAAMNGHLNFVRYLVEQGADMEKTDNDGMTPLNSTCCNDVDFCDAHLNVVRYLLEQGADRDKANTSSMTPLHHATIVSSDLQLAKLLMVYGADINARSLGGQSAIDMVGNPDEDEIVQSIRDEPRRRIDEAPGKRAIEEERHPGTATSASAQQEDGEEEEDGEPGNKNPRLDEETEAADGDLESETDQGCL